MIMTMTRNQNIVMWAGLIILLVYLFTDRNFKGAIFGTSGGSTSLQLDSFTATGNAVTNPWAYPTAPVAPPKKTAAPPKKTTLL